MVYSMADRLLEQGEKRGREKVREEGRKLSREEGIDQTRTTIAIVMLKDELPIDTVAKYTGLSESVCKKLQMEIEQLTESIGASR